MYTYIRGLFSRDTLSSIDHARNWPSTTLFSPNIFLLLSLLLPQNQFRENSPRPKIVAAKKELFFPSIASLSLPFCLSCFSLARSFIVRIFRTSSESTPPTEPIRKVTCRILSPVTKADKKGEEATTTTPDTKKPRYKSKSPCVHYYCTPPYPASCKNCVGCSFIELGPYPSSSSSSSLQFVLLTVSCIHTYIRFLSFIHFLACPFLLFFLCLGSVSSLSVC